MAEERTTTSLSLVGGDFLGGSLSAVNVSCLIELTIFFSRDLIAVSVSKIHPTLLAQGTDAGKCMWFCEAFSLSRVTSFSHLTVFARTYVQITN